MTHLDIVKLLVNNRADIQKPNFNGGTCLINRYRYYKIRPGNISPSRVS